MEQDLSQEGPSRPPIKAGSRFEGSTSLLEAIIHSSDDAIFTKDLNGIITSWNPAAIRMFGYLPEEILGHSILQLIPEELHFQEAEILSRLRAGEQIAHFETRRVTKAGEKLTVSLTISPIRDAEGRVVGASKIVRDISEQKALDEARFRLAAIVESSDDAIISKDLNGIITSWNKAAEHLFGYTPEEMIGASILKLIPSELRSEEEMILSKLRAGERIEHFETVRVSKHGERLDVSLTISPLKDRSGKVIGASKVLRDVSQRKHLERSLVQAEKIAATGRMAATIAHEINNPLEAVLNLVYLARVSCSEPEVAHYLHSAEDEIRRLAQIATQTLGYYREHNTAVRVSLTDMVTSALKVYEPKIRHAGVLVETHFGARSEVFLRRGEMMQVISNLITNAIHAMPSGGRLTIEVADANRRSHDGVTLSVQDTGGGIPEQYLDRIFEPFFTTRDGIGTGIGLWLARQFVDGHGGSIDVQSSTAPETHGTKMTIFLPQQPMEEQEPSVREAVEVLN